MSPSALSSNTGDEDNSRGDSILRSMSTPPVATPAVERAERLLGLREPKPRSRFWVAYFALWGALILGLFLWAVLRGGGWLGDEAFWLWGALFSSVWICCDTGGSLLYVRRGAPWGRTLRALGYALFLPLAMGFYLVAFWFSSIWAFVVEALFVGAIVMPVVVRAVKGTTNDG